jgi:fibronectin-binding autotransporter adhesin
MECPLLTPLLTISNGVAKATAADAGSTVTVSNGTYGISATIAIGAGITVRSYGGGVTGGLANAALTTVYRSGNNIRIFAITHASAVVEGLTIEGGNVDFGGGVNMTGGLVRDCIIRYNNIGDNKSAGGVYMTGGTVSNCVIKSNSKGGGTGNGGGIYATGGLIVNCQITDNSTGNNDGGGVYLMTGGTGATLRNCFLTRNTSARAGGGVWVSSGTIENCTIIGNYAGTSGGGGIYRNSGSAGTIRDCIVYFNTSSHATYKNAYSGDSGWTYNCTTNPVVTGTAGCISGDPLFRNYAEGNYQLSTGSPCIDKGTPVTWTTDLAGNIRTQDGDNNGTATVDMGAYEYSTTLNCDFLASPRALIASPTTYQAFGPAPLTVQFTGWADGTNLTGLVYRWDFDNDTNYEQEGLNLTSVSYTYTNAGVYTPRLQVTNSTEIAEKIKSAYVSAGATHYVITNNPTAAAPYTSWATAASNNIQAAINAVTLNGSQVVISNGTYRITAQLANINILTVRSFERGLSGASNTVVQGSGTTRIFSIGNMHAVVEGLTIRNGSGVDGAGVNMSAGLVRDCIIRNNTTGDNKSGGGVYMNGGTVSNCIITANSKGNGNGSGGGVYAIFGTLLYCQITDNSVGVGNGGGVCTVVQPVYGNPEGLVTIRNCLIRNNTAANVGGGVWMQNTYDVIESCTIVTNRANGTSNAGGGVYREKGTVRNCVVYLNTAPNNPANANFYAGSGATEYSASDPQPTGTGNILAGVTFQNTAANDYRLKACAAVDAGTTLSWMTGALDLAGGPRIVNSIVDMGAYEAPAAPPKGTVIMLR